ncbi:GNAT family N-acetyltransferase [Shewanella woodyi]|uniref:GNAT family N-acetyltransferase n=1 Tax=Shewanella woodyi TaxID=60961 RepID=UPI0007F91E59|nr:GNAT family N-acetyltransferase [Shewanella woodyi]
MLVAPKIMTQRTVLTLLQHYEYQLLIDYYERNHSHLSPWEPEREQGYFEQAQVRERVQCNNAHFFAGGAVHFVARGSINHDGSVTADHNGPILGVCNFTNIVRGPFQACYLGYSVDKALEGQGVMREILEAGINYIFKELKLHRIMANYIPDNTRSGHLLSSLGFEKEGVAKAYLKINGRWQDHLLTSKLNPNDA